MSIVRGYDEDRLLDLVAINLHGVTETVTDDYQNSNSDIGHGYQNSNRGGYQNSNTYTLQTSC